MCRETELRECVAVCSDVCGLVSQEDVLEFFDSHIAKGSPQRRMLLCRVYCAAHVSKMEKEAKSTMKAAAKEFGEAEVEHVPDCESWREGVSGRDLFSTTV